MQCDNYALEELFPNSYTGKNCILHFHIKLAIHVIKLNPPLITSHDENLCFFTVQIGMKILFAYLDILWQCATASVYVGPLRIRIQHIKKWG